MISDRRRALDETLRHLVGVPQAFVIVVAILGVAAPDILVQIVSGISTTFIATFDWLILSASTMFLVLCVALAVSKYGRIKLGRPDEAPAYDTLSWLAMLFAAGMGAGLVFWGAAEPVQLMLQPPTEVGAPGSPDAIDRAFRLVYLHWTLHPWGIYAMAALTIAYFGFCHDQPLLPSAPLRAARADAGDGTPGWREQSIDSLALLGVVFGVVASLGQGILQIGAGWHAWMDWASPGWPTYLAVTVLLSSCYLLSTAGGIENGIKPLSDFNLVLCAALLLFVFATGPTLALAARFVTSLGDYLVHLAPLSITLRQDDPAGLAWTRDWTLTYFMWWIAWGPFVGVFIARISRGRTIRQFLFGVLLVPSLFSMFWFAALGGEATAIAVSGDEAFVATVLERPSAATHALLERLPFAQITTLLALVLMFVFLVTSADSGAYVLGIFSAKGDAQPPVSLRLFWGVVLALLTTWALGTGRGTDIMRSFAVVGAIPYLFIMLWQVACLLRALWQLNNSSETNR